MMTRLSDLDLRHMQVFMTVAENRGFVAAQETLNLGLSTISSHMTALEKRLGVRLCDRGRGGFRLTEEGQKVYEIAQRLTGTMSAASSELAALRKILVGLLRIGIVDNVVNNPSSAIHLAIHQFDRREHEVKVSIEVMSPRDLERQVADGMLDVGVGSRINSLGTLDYHVLFTERQHLYCGRLHPKFCLEPSDWTADNIAKEKYAGHICPLPEEAAYSNLLRAESVVHHMESVAILIRSGRFIGFLPEHYAAYWVACSEMKLINTAFCYDNTFYAMHSSRQKTNRIVAQFVEDLRWAHAETQPPAAPSNEVVGRRFVRGR
jgi:LysR family transcriptional regulator, transcriptional activator for bauABCD operon